MSVMIPLLNGIVMSSIIMAPSLGLTITYGTARFVNFAFGDIIAIGAFIGIWGSATMGLAGGIFASFVITGVIGMIFARILFKPIRNMGPLVLLIVSLGLGICIRNFIVMIRGTTPISNPLPLLGSISLGPIDLGINELLIILLSTVAFGTFYLIYQNTKLGAKIKAVSANRTLAKTMGLNVERTISLVWLTGCGLAGLGGLLYTFLTSVSPMFGWEWMIMAFTVVLVGGIGSVKGVVIGSFVVGVGEQFASYYWTPGYSMGFVFAVLILMLIIRPQGIAKGLIREEV